MEKWTFFKIRKGRGRGDGTFLRLQTDGINSNRRKPYLIDNIPRRTWLIIEKEGTPKKKDVPKVLAQQTDDGRKMKDLEQLLLDTSTVLGRYQTRQSTTTNSSTVPYSYPEGKVIWRTQTQTMITSFIFQRNLNV